MKKILSCLTVATLLTSSATNLVSFQTKLNNVNKNIKTKNKTTFKNKTSDDKSKDIAKANAIMTKLANKNIEIPSFGPLEMFDNQALQTYNLMQWALNEIVSQTASPYKFYWANSDGNKVLSTDKSQSILIGMEVNGTKSDTKHQANINVILSKTSIYDMLKTIRSKVNNSYISLVGKSPIGKSYIYIYIQLKIIKIK